MSVQIYEPKCPYCGWIRHIEMDIDADEVSVVKGIAEDVRAFMTRFDQRHETENWMDMPPCTNCEKTYQFNPDTGATRK